MMKKWWGYAFLAAATYLSSGAAQAQKFPERPVEITVLFGGSAQTVGQVLADQMSKTLGSPVVAVPRPGGGGAVGYNYVKGQPADGYHLVWNSNSISTTYYQGNLPFDYKAFTPIARVGIEVPVLAVRKDSGWATLKDMVESSKKSGNKLKIAVGGKGSFTHILAAALMKRAGGGETIYVPGGTGTEITELLGGRVDAALRFPSEVKTHVEAGTLVVLCATTKEKFETGIKAPTCNEAGATGLDFAVWRGLAAPAGAPADVIGKLEAVAKTATNSEEFKKASDKLGFLPAFLPGSDFGKLIAKDDGEIAALMKELSLTAQK